MEQFVIVKPFCGSELGFANHVDFNFVIDQLFFTKLISAAFWMDFYPNFIAKYP